MASHAAVRSVAALTFLGVFGAATATWAGAPTKAEKVTAIATVVKAWRERPKGTPGSQQMAIAIAVLVFDAAGADEPMKPSPEDQQRVAEIIAAVKAQGADATEAVDVVLAQFRSFGCASKQSEAKANLKGLYVAEKAFYAERDTYDADVKKLGYEPETKRYKIEILKADANHFQARAVGFGDMAGDEWTIDDATMMPVNKKNLCAK